MHVEELCRAGDGKLVLHAAGEKVIEIIRQEKTARRHIFDRRTARNDFSELKTTIIKDVRNSRRRVNAVERSAGVAQRFQTSLRACVAVRVHRENKTARVVE